MLNHHGHDVLGWDGHALKNIKASHLTVNRSRGSLTELQGHLSSGLLDHRTSTVEAVLALPLSPQGPAISSKKTVKNK